MVVAIYSATSSPIVTVESYTRIRREPFFFFFLLLFLSMLESCVVYFNYTTLADCVVICLPIATCMIVHSHRYLVRKGLFAFDMVFASKNHSLI